MNPYSQAPHAEGPPKASADAPNAALLIDFDNVTMGMRSDLSKELKSLLQSAIIRGKVTVQRAYADWRRYPQYIVPLSEASVDLIFAPAYGSSKKNATDIRMAIDGLELVFIRPEIGTFILLTGDSDFSSLVLKLKEYGKYVIGVGIQESSSDILVQNCDEYYSYTSLTGLRKTTDTVGKPSDPWELVGEALDRMIKRHDVMRSDRLKQVMIEIDGSFSEGSYGFSKFSKFLAEASSRGVVQLHKLENGQYEVKLPGEASVADKGDRDRRGRAPSRRTRAAQSRADKPERREPAPPAESAEKTDPDPLPTAYDLMLACLRTLKENGKESVRDSDVKRRMLQRDPRFDEAELGFGKFSRFLLQAKEHGIIDLEKTETGNYRVSLHKDDSGIGPPPREEPPDETASVPEAAAAHASARVLEPIGPVAPGRLGLRSSSPRRPTGTEGPVLFEGQAVGTSTRGRSSAPSTAVPLDRLGLPSGSEAMIRYLTNSYKGVGKKTAAALVDAFGKDLFDVFQDAPHRVSEVVPRRAEQVLAEWRTDYIRRTEALPKEEEPPVVPTSDREQALERKKSAERPTEREHHAGEGRRQGGARASAERRRPSTDRKTTERQSRLRSERGSARGEGSSARPAPRGRGAPRRTRSGSRRQPPLSDPEPS